MSTKKLNLTGPISVSVDGYYDTWEAWGDCSEACAGGTQIRVRACVQPQYGGNDCTPGDGEETRACNEDPCPGKGFNTLRPKQNGRHFADDVFKDISMNENFWILTTISLKYVPWGLVDNMTALVQIMAWRRPGVKPLFEPMMLYVSDAYVRHWAAMS